MTDLDLDRLGDLWRQRPTKAELEALERTAETVRRRARWAQLIDAGAAIVVAALVILLVLYNPEMDTMLVGGGAIVLLLASQARTRRLRAEELRGLTGSTEEMLDQSIKRARATLKRTRFQLLAIGPSFLLGLGVATLVDRRSGVLQARLLSDPSLGFWIASIALLVLVAVVIAFGRSMRTTRHELDRLVELREAFQEEVAPNSAH